VDLDGTTATYDSLSATLSRSINKPLEGFRRNLGHLIKSQMCYLNNPAESEIDRFVAGYQTCVFELTEK